MRKTIATELDNIIRALSRLHNLFAPHRILAADAIRDSSELYKVEQILRDKKKPMHIDEILWCLEVAPIERAAKKVSIAGSMKGYAKKHKVFKAYKGNIFGLISYD